MGLSNWLTGLFGGGDDGETETADAEATTAATGGGDGSSGGETEAAPADAQSAAPADADAGGDAGADGDADATGEVSTDDAPETENVGEEGTPPTEGAEMLVEQATAHDYDLNYSPGSLRTLDQLVEDLPDEGLVKAAPHFAGYLGEVFTTHYDGVWTLHDDVGWVVELPSSEEPGGTTTLVVAHAVQSCLEADATFKQAHDDTLDLVNRDGPSLTDEPYPEDLPGPTLEGPATDEVPEDHVTFYKELAEELSEAWPEKDLDYSPGSLERLDELVDEIYDLTTEAADADDEADDAAEADAAEVAEDATDDATETATDGEGGVDDGADAEDADEGDADADAEDADEADDDADADADDADDEGGDPIVPADVDLGVTDGRETQAFAGYVGEVFVRNYAAEWRRDGELPVLVVEGETATAEIDPIRLVAGAFHGQTSFAEVHDQVVDDAGLESQA